MSTRGLAIYGAVLRSVLGAIRVWEFFAERPRTRVRVTQQAISAPISRTTLKFEEACSFVALKNKCAIKFWFFLHDREVMS